MQDILEEFEKIDSEHALRAFLQKHGFRLADSRSHADQYVLGAFIGKLNERQVKITHRLLPDDHTAHLQDRGRNQIVMEMQDAPLIEVYFRGNY